MGISKTVDLDHFAAILDDYDPTQLDWTKPLKRCAVAVRSSALECFEQSHGPDGEPWAALRFPRVQGGDRPLYSTGTLMASVTARGSRGSVENITSLSMEVGTADERAAVHQQGVPGPAWDGRPKKAKALAIPLTKQAQRAGSPRNFPGTLFLAARKGKPALLYEYKPGRKKDQRGAQSVPQYILVAQVKIPARPFLGWGEKLVETVTIILGEFLANGEDR